MQNTNAHVTSEEHEEIPNEGKAAQQLEQILASGLPPLYRRAYRILGNAADAEDAVQDALLAAYTHVHQFKGQAQISTWLTTILLNCARLQLRRRSTRLTHLHSQLSPTLRRTFQLRDVEGLSIRETTQILGVPTGTVKAQSARARKKLKELMRRTLRPQYGRLPSRLLEFASSTS